jgi:D-tyrosyl-tRNA(Tyr) deacylase
VGFTKTDTKKIVDAMVEKILKLRIYEDDQGKINNVIPHDHEILSISQFTLYAQTKGQNRPSFIDAMTPEEASALYTYFNQTLAQNIHVKEGQFGAYMEINSINSGPMTILLEL